jgi:hypothetical protein
MFKEFAMREQNVHNINAIKKLFKQLLTEREKYFDYLRLKPVFLSTEYPTRAGYLKSCTKHLSSTIT